MNFEKDVLKKVIKYLNLFRIALLITQGISQVINIFLFLNFNFSMIKSKICIQRNKYEKILF